MKIRKMKQLLTGMLLIGVLLTGCGAAEDKTAVRVGGLKGPTTIGLLSLQEKAESGAAKQDYEFQMMTAADELTPLLVKGELDIALLPANMASVLYQKTGGQISVIDINTLGVLYMVSGDSAIESAADLEGRTIYLTGKGTTPDYVLRYIMKENGLDETDYSLEYKSEAAEVAAVLTENPDAVGLLPQPFVTSVCAQKEGLNVVLDMNEQWASLQGEDGSRLVTGVTVVRNEFLKEHEKAVKSFLSEHEESTKNINADTDKAAALAVKAGIIPKEAVAKKAIPNCNITYIDGEEMKQSLSGYLEVLFAQDAASVGGALPADDFYYIP